MKKRFACVAAAVIFLGVNPIAVTAGIPNGKKLGYGFADKRDPGKDYVDGELIVGIRNPPRSSVQRRNALEARLVQAARSLGGRTIASLDGKAVLLRFPDNRMATAAARRFLMRSEVIFVERNGFMSIPRKPKRPEYGLPKEEQNDILNQENAIGINSVSDDPSAGFQWHHVVIGKTSQFPEPETPFSVAVIDTGVDYTHTDLSGENKVMLGYDFADNDDDPYDENGHGTHVAGILAANAGNGAYGEGVCPNCRILAVRVLDAQGYGTIFDIALGMLYAATYETPPGVPPVMVLNMSLGDTESSLLINAMVSFVKTTGKVLVASAGNDLNYSISYPGANPDTALRVMATEENDCRVFFSNFSTPSDPSRYNIAAPGWMIPSILPEESYGIAEGTSMAAPIVAGAAAMVWGENPTLTRDELVDRLISTGKSTNCGFPVPTPRIDLRRALSGTSETGMIGRILDPSSGRVPAPTVPFSAWLHKWATTSPDPVNTNKGGWYEITDIAPDSGYTLTGNRNGYVTADLRRNIRIAPNEMNGPFTDAMVKNRPEGNVTISLNWKNWHPFFGSIDCTEACLGWEMDTYVKLPNGEYIEYGNRGSLDDPPYVMFMRDSWIDTIPMETTVVGSSAEDGAYPVFINLFAFADLSVGNPSWAGSSASVRVYNGDQLIGSADELPSSSSCGTMPYWYVGNLVKTGSNYTWEAINSCTDIMP